MTGPRIVQRAGWLLGTALLLWLQPGCSGNGRVDIPQSILDAETAAILWVDVRALKPSALEEGSLVITGAVPEDVIEDVRPLVDTLRTQVGQYREFQRAFTQAGGRGLLLGVSPSEKRSEKPALTAFVRADPDWEGPRLADALHRFFDPVLNVQEVVSFHEKWLRIKGDGLQIPRGGTADAAVNLSKALDRADGPVKVGLRMTERVKGLLEAADNPQAAAFFYPLKPAVTGSLALRFGSDPAISAQFRFEDEKVAHEFDRFYQGLLVMAQGATMARLKGSSHQPSEEELRRLSHRLHMERVMDKLSLDLQKSALVRLMPPISRLTASIRKGETPASPATDQDAESQ